jgi:4-hydroxy-L-threonine phosphate dehydrogenase PdxA
MAGNASFEAVKKVIDLALAGEVDATVTGPINKKSINEAGHHLPGTPKYTRILHRHQKIRHAAG